MWCLFGKWKVSVQGSSSDWVEELEIVSAFVALADENKENKKSRKENE